MRIVLGKLGHCPETLENRKNVFFLSIYVMETFKQDEVRVFDGKFVGN